MDQMLSPFNAVLLILGGIGAVVGGFVAIDKWQEVRVDQRIKAKKLEEREAEEKRLEEMITRIVALAFTGRAEADNHFRAEALGNYRTALREALDEHARDERHYIDTLRDKIVEYHALTLQAVQDAKRVGLTVHAEYAEIKRRLGELDGILQRLSDLEREVEALRSEVRRLGPQNRVEE